MREYFRIGREREWGKMERDGRRKSGGRQI